MEVQEKVQAQQPSEEQLQLYAKLHHYGQLCSKAMMDALSYCAQNSIPQELRDLDRNENYLFTVVALSHFLKDMAYAIEITSQMFSQYIPAESIVDTVYNNARGLMINKAHDLKQITTNMIDQLKAQEEAKGHAKIITQ